MYTVDYFIDKFQKIPEEKWCVQDLHSLGKSCAAGHCGVRNNRHLFLSEIELTEEANALGTILLRHPLSDREYDHNSNKGAYRSIYMVNDGNGVFGQLGSTPKQRILAALYDIKKMQQPTIKEVDTIVGEFIPITFSQIEELQSAN